jgi:hypothetical protein
LILLTADFVANRDNLVEINGAKADVITVATSLHEKERSLLISAKICITPILLN